MTDEATARRDLAAYLLSNDRMIVEATAEMLEKFPLTSGMANEEAWLRAAAYLLGDAVELRKSRATGPLTLVVKDRAVLFNYTQTRTLEDMAKARKAEENA